MVITVKNHSYDYDIENIGEIFFPYEKIKMCFGEDYPDDPITVKTEILGKNAIADAKVYDKQLRREREIAPDSDGKSELSLVFYDVLSSLLGIEYPWGILYGVRPARYFHSLTDKFGIENAKSIFKNQYLVTDEKINLTQTVANSENKIIALSKSNSFSLYVSIPFCPTRCSYCSFVSHSIENTHKLIGEYVELLAQELVETAKYAKQLNLRLESIYFGGGTPTTLSASQLEFLFETIKQNFDLSFLREYTVEAGRPDTVTDEKFEVMQKYGVGRVSINPQTFNDDVREFIGRHHTTAQTLDALKSARNAGFDNINMDFIAGLPTESEKSFCNSIDKAIELEVPSVTVHTLSLKTGAYMATRDRAFDLTDKLLAKNMVDYSAYALKKAGYKPYYMYRQGKCLGNLENVGWCKDGYECLYNIFMMDETHTVLAAGAGAVIKLKDFNTGKIERIYNYKYPYEYISGFDEILHRKEKITKFYDKYKQN